MHAAAVLAVPPADPQREADPMTSNLRVQPSDFTGYRRRHPDS
jgi:hypothetical protein